jgi:ABC-type dipeptide/oligopeptide/nickel transport system ATPase component
MDGGLIVEEDVPEAIFSHPRHPRTREFLSRILAQGGEKPKRTSNDQALRAAQSRLISLFPAAPVPPGFSRGKCMRGV